MAEQLLQFGDESTADIKLQLIGTNGGDSRRINALYVHSQILKKSEFYETLLCERWSSEKPTTEMEITTFHSIEMYTKCIQLMYSSQSGNSFRYSSVDETLSILQIASELLFHNCVEECMRYLNAVRWSTKQEIKLRALLLSMEINTLPDLAARLGISQWKSDYGGNLQMLEHSLRKMLSAISCGSYTHSEYIEEYIVGFFEANSSFAETCRCALLKEFSANIERAKSDKYAVIPIACSALLWIVNVIQRCDVELFEKVFNSFCQDAELPVAINRSYIGYSAAVRPYSDLKKPLLGLTLFDLIDRFLNVLGNGEIITSTSFRVSFLANWVPISVNTVTPKDRNKLERGIIGVAETLPLAEQRRIYNIWKEVATKNYTETFKCWSKKVEDAIQRHSIFFI